MENKDKNLLIKDLCSRLPYEESEVSLVEHKEIVEWLYKIKERLS